MKQFLAILIVVLCLGLNCLVLAQSEDGCRDVLLYSARNTSVENYDSGVALKVYDQYCENDSVRSGTSFDAKLAAIIKGVPARFGLAGNSTEERTRNFCKSFDSDYKSRQQYYREISTVVNETTNAWLKCKQLAGEGVVFRPQIGQTQILLGISRTNATPASVEGIFYDSSLLTCKVPNTDQSNTESAANSTTRKTLTDTSWFISCTRTPKSEANQTIFPKFELSVITNSNGSDRIMRRLRRKF